ncbi:hypothetical protein [Streptomyces sp. 7N604]|uniref:hypothetical protein n=1 Tax=Streptomyces sp. 7N604 TaxID=3457415 RepID=UPI003FCFB493
MPVPERTVRRAYLAAVDAITLNGIAFEDLQAPPAGDDDEQAAEIASRAFAAGARGTMLPARIRRLDERLAQHLRAAGAWPPQDLDRLDCGPTVGERFTTADFSTVAVITLLRGGAAVTPESMARSLGPSNRPAL